MSNDHRIDCQSFEGFLAALVDGELEPGERTSLDAHLAECRRCRDELASQVQVKELVGSRLPRPVAPVALKERILELIEQGARPIPVRKAGWIRRLVTQPVPAWAVALILMIGSLVLVTGRGGGPETDLAVREAVANHLHMLQGHYLPMEVQSDDPAEVSEWLTRNLSQATPVPRLPGEEISLVGGRMCHLGGKPAGYACYVWKGRLLGLFVMQRASLELDSDVRKRLARQGYARLSREGCEILIWEDGENAFLLVVEEEASGVLDELMETGWEGVGWEVG